MTDTMTEPETTATATTAEPVTAAAIVAAEIDRRTAGGATFDNLYAFRTGATPIAQVLLDAVRGFGLRSKATAAAQVHAALGLIAIAAVTKAEPLERDSWWEDYPEDTLMGHLAARLRKRSDCSFSSPVLKAAFTTAAGVLTDDAFDAAEVSVRSEDRSLLLAIGSHATLADLTDSSAAKGMSSDEVQAAADAMVKGGVLYLHTYFGYPASYVPTPAGAVILKQLQEEREARRKAEEAKRQARLKALAAKRDAAVDALVPEFTAAHAALNAAFSDLNRAWRRLSDCEDADLAAATEDFDRTQAAAGDAARTWTTLRGDLERHLHGSAYGWPAGGRDRLAAVLEEAGIDLGPDLTGPARRLPQALPALIAHQNEHLAAVLASRPAHAPEPAPAPEPAKDVARWRLLALAAAALAAVLVLVLVLR
jgi:hypothetical protein